jgi:hypothetical protein
VIYLYQRGIVPALGNLDLFEKIDSLRGDLEFVGDKPVLFADNLAFSLDFDDLLDRRNRIVNPRIFLEKTVFLLRECYSLEDRNIDTGDIQQIGMYAVSRNARGDSFQSRGIAEETQPRSKGVLAFLLTGLVRLMRS